MISRDVLMRESYRGNAPALPETQRTSIYRDPLHALRRFRQGNAYNPLNGFSAFRQLPDLGIGLNLIKDGACSGIGVSVNGGVPAPYWTKQGVTAVVKTITDPTSPTGFAVQLVAAAQFQIASPVESILVETGKQYTAKVWLKSDGVADVRLEIRSYTPSGAGPTYVADSGAFTTAAWTEKTITFTAPGNANRIEFRAAMIYNAIVSPSTVYAAGARLVPGATCPAWSTAMQNASPNKGLDVYEGATNLLTNGDIETALSGTVNGFVDTFANLAAWVLDSGSTFTVAANVVSNAAGGENRMRFGHAEWWDIAGVGASSIRLRWVTGGIFYWYLRWIDINNWLRVAVDGSLIYMQKSVAGTVTAVGTNVAAALTNGNWYWLLPGITGTTVLSTVLANDNAGAVGTTVATHAGGTVSDSALSNARMAIGMSGGTGMQFGGAFSNVLRVVIAAPPGFTVNDGPGSSGPAAYCVSKVNPFSGTYSVSIYKPTGRTDAASGAAWQQTFTAANAVYTLSARVRTSAVVSSVGGGARISLPNGTNYSTAITGTNDWQAISLTPAALAAGASAIGARMDASDGTAWFDLLWLAQQAYDTGNSDLSAQAYVPTGARIGTASSFTPPTGFAVTDYALVVAYRPDHGDLVGYERALATVYTGAGERYDLWLSTIGILFARQVHGGVETQKAAATPHPNAGDSVVAAMRVGSVVDLFYSVNGAAVTKVTSAALAAQLAASTSIFVGELSQTSNNCDGTIGVVRVLRKQTPDSVINALVLAPYQAPTPYDLEVWTFDGAAAEVPNAQPQYVGAYVAP